MEHSSTPILHPKNPSAKYCQNSSIMILVGTSGFSYPDWVGPFYPESLPKQELLAFYSEHFRTCELNFSYYRVPTAHSLERMAEKSDGQVEFVLKANKDMTHERSENAQVFTMFKDAMTPLIERNLLGCILAQFPYSFHHTQKNLDYLSYVRDQLESLPVVVEFRNRKWLKQDTFTFLKESHFGFCCVDEPQIQGLLPPVVVATSPIGYVRFHGRNQARWWKHDDPAERYDYLYNEEELQEWVPRVHTLAKVTEKVYIFTNNHPGGKAVQNARRLQELL